MLGWSFGMKVPMEVSKGYVGQSLGGNNSRGGSIQLERITPDPIDGFANSKATVRWGEESTWLGFGTPWTTRELEVTEDDAAKDMRATLARTAEGRAELVVTNGEGRRSTELRFPLGQADSVQEGFDLRGDSLKVTHRERKSEQETHVSMGGANYILRNGRLETE